VESRRLWIHLCSVPVSRLHAGDNNLIFWLSPDVLCGSKQIADHTHDLAELYSNIWPTCYPNMLLSFQHTLSCLGRLYCTFSEFMSDQTARERERERENLSILISKQQHNLYISYSLILVWPSVVRCSYKWVLKGTLPLISKEEEWSIFEAVTIHIDRFKAAIFLDQI